VRDPPNVRCLLLELSTVAYRFSLLLKEVCLDNLTINSRVLVHVDESAETMLPKMCQLLWYKRSGRESQTLTTNRQTTFTSSWQSPTHVLWRNGWTCAQDEWEMNHPLSP
jgi:hypothetical protein